MCYPKALDVIKINFPHMLYLNQFVRFQANRANLLEADNKDDKDNNDIRSTAEGSHKTGTAESFYSQHSLHLNSKLKRPSRRKVGSLS